MDKCTKLINWPRLISSHHIGIRLYNYSLHLIKYEPHIPCLEVPRVIICCNLLVKWSGVGGTLSNLICRNYNLLDLIESIGNLLFVNQTPGIVARNGSVVHNSISGMGCHMQCSPGYLSLGCHALVLLILEWDVIYNAYHGIWSYDVIYQALLDILDVDAIYIAIHDI